MNMLYTQTSVVFDITLIDTGLVGGTPITLACPNTTLSNCRITFTRTFTPVLSYINPRVVYDNSEVAFYVDPKNAQNYKISTENFFDEARINQQTIGFENYISTGTTITATLRNQVKGLTFQNLPVASGVVNFKFKAGDSFHEDGQMLVCSYDNSTCYKSKVVPVVKQISSSQGYTTGGQTITVTGSGFTTGNIQTTIDGAACTLKTFTSTQFTCETGANDNPSNDTYYVGTPGLKRSFYISSNTLTFDSLPTTTPSSRLPQMSFEINQNQRDGNSGNTLSGYFKAPATGNYRFYMSCDDACTLQLSKVDRDPTSKEQILSIGSYTSYRGYLLDSTKVSNWISLQGNGSYYIEANHIQYSGGDHLTVSFETDANTLANHYHSMREIQRLEIKPLNLIRDTAWFNATINVPNCTVNVTFRDSSTNTIANFAFIPINTDGPTFRNYIKDLYYKSYSADINVTRTMYDANNISVSDLSQAVWLKYKIEVLKSISSATIRTISINSGYTCEKAGSSISSTQAASTKPLSGNFVVQCTLLNGAMNQSSNILVTSTPATILTAITNTCPQYRDKFDIWDNGIYQSTLYSDGRDLIIRFLGFTDNPPQLTILSSNTTGLGLGGNTNPVNNSIVLTMTTLVPYSTNLMYEPIPYDFLFNAQTKPQIQVKVDGVDAVCQTSDLTCGYTYIKPDSIIDYFSFNNQTRKLTIKGTALPTSDLKSVSFGNNNCVVQSSNDTCIICILETTTTGDWKPIVMDSNGKVPVNATLSEETIPMTVTDVNPKLALNPEGDNILTITGTNFPPSLSDGSNINITLSDGTKCTVISSTPTELKCMTDKFSAFDNDTVYTVIGNVWINNQTEFTVNITVATAPAAIIGTVPSIVSPVLKTDITFQLDPEYGGVLVKDDLIVKLIKFDDASVVKELNVFAVDNTLRTITARYGGAYSGVYNITVKSIALGKFNCGGIYITAVGKVTDFSPKTGSINGGTLITITGYNFSTDPLDNNVRVGLTDCLVLTSQNDQITCRTLPKRVDITNIDEESEPLIVFLKLSEEAKCSVQSGDCSFKWINDALLPNITSFSVAFNPTINDYELTLIGTDFPTTTSDIIMRIDTFDQVVTFANSTQITVKIVNMLSSTSKNLELYFPVGTPAGFDQLLQSGITLTPVPISVSPLQGSPAGTLLTAIVKGVGINTELATVTTNTGSEICLSVNITEYSKIKCITKPIAITTDVLRVKVGKLLYNCTTNDSCTYQTLSTMPAISALSLSGSSLTITGTGFFTSDYTAKVTYTGIPATTVSIDSETQVTATWSNGFPLSVNATEPVLYFENPTTAHWASNTQTISNAPTVTALDSSVSCSFAGGCKISVTQPGLLTSLQNNNTKLTVCGKKAEISTSDSTAQKVTFILPSLATTYSVNNYKISQESQVIGTPFSSSKSQAHTKAPFDKSTQNEFKDTSVGPCYVGSAFADKHVGFLSEVKFFIVRFNPDNFANALIFQGSKNGVNYTDIFTVSDEIHEGWNYYSFREEKRLKYRYYRFFSNNKQSCTIAEVAFTGLEIIDDDNSVYSSCPIQLILNGGSPISLSGSIIYTSALTPLLTGLSPRYGQVQGGDLITFTGSNFVTDSSQIKITIDGINCPIVSADTTQIQCLTGKRPGLYPNTQLGIYITGYGNTATQGLLFRYCNYWSNEETWGNQFIPTTNETVYIPPGLNLLVDIDSSPLLAAVLVEGSLIFPSNDDPNHVRTFDANYIMVKNGYLEIGTKEFPYTSKLIITMYGDIQSPEIPIYGNKVLAVREGVLEMHGKPRNPTWTELNSTAIRGDNKITLHTSVDWQVGEEIVIAPTGYNPDEAEVRTIVSVDNTNPDNPVITLNDTLKYKHYAATEKYGDDKIDMRAEVGLLTRNVIFRGDPDTSALNQYGAHILLHSYGDESLIGRIEYVELKDVGQAYQIGRYPINFHQIGTLHNSYVYGNSIHHTYNRGITMHAVHYLRVIKNVIFQSMGHTIFIEDGIETKNFIQENLVIKTKRSWSLLNTDQTPASFWITNPDNIFRGNRAAGSDRYGYWFDPQPFATGSSYTQSVCPQNVPLGEFTNNVAHSNGRYGLRIYNRLNPRLKPCKGIYYDSANTTNPYWKNPLVTAKFINTTSYKNQKNGAIAEQVGDVRFIGFKVADNLVAGIEVSLTNLVADGYPQINNALVVGYSNNSEPVTLRSNFLGIITPRTENFQVNGAKFYNFNLSTQAAAIGSCSHCYYEGSTDSGARTTTFSKLFFDPKSVKQIIRYQYPYNAIFYDLDGTLTGQGSKTWATPYFAHNDQPECQRNDSLNGLVCDSTVQVRRLAVSGADDFWLFWAAEMKILKYDDDIINNLSPADYQSYLNNDTNYGVVPFKVRQDPYYGWTVPYVTGHKYKLHWRSGLDFNSIQIDKSARWQTKDKNVHLVLNFTDVREKVDVIANGEIVENQTLINKTSPKWDTGDNVIFNDTSIRQIRLVINGKNSSRNSIKLIGYRCVYSCSGSVEDQPVETTVRRWSDPASWPNNQIPIAGQDAEIKPGWNMLFDMEDMPIINMLEINGRLTFENGVKNLHLRAKYIFVRAGELIVGTPDAPFNKDAKITLYGEKKDQHIAYRNAIEAGNKMLVNTNLIQMYGIQRTKFTRLLQEVQSGDASIFVEPQLDWKDGDKIGLLASTIQFDQSEEAIISSYNKDTGEVVLQNKVKYYHYGANQSTASKYGGLVDIRGEVILLSRNIQISGEDKDNWGCQILTSSYFEESGKLRLGSTLLDSVEIYNCSQYDTYKAALRFDTVQDTYSIISNSSIYDGLGKGVQIIYAENIALKSNSIFGFTKLGINIGNSKNISIDGNIVADIGARQGLLLVGRATELTGGIYACAEDSGDGCYQISITNNIIAGIDYTGVVAMGHNCNDSNSKNFKNNVVHSVRGTGAIIYPDPSSESQQNCMEASNFAAYKVTQDGAISYFSYNQVQFKDMIFIDNGFGPTALIGREGENLEAKLKNIIMYGESDAKDCAVEDECSFKQSLACTNRSGLMVSYFSSNGKPILATDRIDLPMHKIRTDASWGGKSTYEGLQFIGFNNTKTYCGAFQRGIVINEYASDYIPIAKFKNTKFENIHPDALAYIMPSKSKWANEDDCGNFPCTAPSNVLIKFSNTIYTGDIQPEYNYKDFQVISNNIGAARGFVSCILAIHWNAYICQNDNLGILLFESLDQDKMRRSVSPITIVSQTSVTNYTNVLNSFMDHVSDGFYAGQQKMSRFPALIQTGSSLKYEIKYTGTPSQNQRFLLNADISGIQLKIDYTKPGAYVILNKDKTQIPANKWVDTLSAPGNLRNQYCGENRYVGVTNILEFYIDQGCLLYIQPLDSIRVNVRMDWTLESFFAAGGTTKFVDRLTASLGIHSSNVQIVQVYQGSVGVIFDLKENGTTPIPGGVKGIQTTLTNLIQSGKINFGAPILSASVGSSPISVINDQNGQNTGYNNNNGGGSMNGGKNNQNNIIVNGDGDNKEDTQKMIIIVVSVIAGVIILGGVIGYFIYQRCKRPDRAQNYPIEKGEVVGQQSNISHMHSAADHSIENYEPQYHPKAELGNIFTSNKKKNQDFDPVAIHAPTTNSNPNSNYGSPQRIRDKHLSNDSSIHLTHDLDQMGVEEGTPLSHKNRESVLPLSKSQKKSNIQIVDEELAKYY